MIPLLRQEGFLLTAAIAAAAAYPLEHQLLASGQAVSLVAALVIIGAILLASVRVAHHAEELAEHVGEPYGTMILRLAAVAVEVVILAIMMSHTRSPTLVRDTIYSAVMLDINALLGVSALLGGLKHGEQPYNVDSGNTYVVMIITALGVSMGLPGYVPAEHWRVYSLFTIVVMVLLYALFLRLQTGRHSYFFSYSYAHHAKARPGPAPTVPVAQQPIGPSIAWIAVGVTLVGLLSEVMSKTLDAGLAGAGVPPLLAPLLVATISASPEILTAVKAALANRMQPVVNIALGASLSTVILTVPIIEALALFTGKPIQMALAPSQIAMVLLTMLAAMINIHDGETNAIEGMTHFVLFMAFLMLSAVAGG
jgi:Ca2+:H+ antiporter